MPAERFFVDAPLGENVTLSGQEFHHLRHVMRNTVGDEIEIVNGRNQLGKAVIEKINKHDCACRLLHVEERKPTARIILAQALPRLNRLETIVEKGVELNVLEFWLFPGALSERKSLSDSQKQRLETIAVSALKQCGRLDLPPILLKPALDTWETVPCPFFFGDTREDASWIQPASSQAMILIGPESGLTEAEEQRLLELRAQGVKLHQNILRVDTAAILGIALLSR